MRQDLYNKKEVGCRIRKYRTNLGFSRAEFALKIGKTEKYFSDIERGYCGMSSETMIRIADCLGLTLDHLIFGEKEEVCSEDIRSILFYLKQCNGKQREKALKILRLIVVE